MDENRDRTEVGTVGFVYFIQGYTERLIKIGHSKQPLRRFHELRIGSPEELYFVGVLVGDRHSEQRLHRKFADHRVRGEWFEPAVPLVNFLKHCGMTPMDRDYKDDGVLPPNWEALVRAYDVLDPS